MKNFLKELLFIGALGVVIHDIIIIFILHKGGWTWFGLVTFTISLMHVVFIWDDFKEQDERRVK
jgi:hypothetical protein